MNQMITQDGFEFRYRPSVIFRAQEPWVFGREPVLRRMPDGSLFCLIYSGGPMEPHNGNLVLGKRSHDEGRTWTKEEVLFNHAARAAWAPELFLGGDQPCIFVHTFDAASYYLELQTYRSFWRPDSRTWSEPVSLPGGLGRVSVRQGIVLESGAWVFPVYWQEALGEWNWSDTGGEYVPHPSFRFFSGALRSTDQGQSFTLHGNLRAECDLWEPNVIEVAPNHLVMLMRAAGVPFKYRAESTDGGCTWTEPRCSDIACANSKITLLRWGDRVLLLHNPAAEPGWDHRRTLSLWISSDGCNTWPVKIDLARALEPHQVICYPDAVLDEANGLLFVACDTTRTHYLLTIPLADLESALQGSTEQTSK